MILKIRLIVVALMFLLIENVSYSQTMNEENSSIIGKVIDSHSKEGIPYATVTLPKSHKGMVTDSLGYYKMPITKNELNTFMYISALGYSVDSILIEQQLLGDTLTTEMIVNEHNLQEVKVFPKVFKFQKLGITKPSKSPGYWNYGMPGLQRAIFIPNSKYLINCTISSLSFYLDTVGFPEAPLRVRLYSVRADKVYPDVDLLQSNIIIRNAKGGEFVNVDLKDFQIEFPENGIFVAIEWLYESEKFYYKKQIERKDKDGNDISFELNGYGPTLGITSVKDSAVYWEKLVGADWKLGSKSSNKIHPVIYITLMEQKQ